MLTPLTLFVAAAVALIASILIGLTVLNPRNRLAARPTTAPTAEETPKSDYTKVPDASTTIERASAARKRTRANA